jgi:hypothetical protein
MSTRGRTSILVSGCLPLFMFPLVSIDLHRLFDATKDNKPTGWFWIPVDDALGLLIHMHSIYVAMTITTLRLGALKMRGSIPNLFVSISTHS